MEPAIAVVVFGAGVVSTTLLGGRIRRALGPFPLVAAERLLLDHVVGVSTVGIVGALVGLAGAYRPWVLTILLLCGPLVDPRRLRNLPAEIARSLSGLRPRGIGERAAVAVVAFFVALAGLGALLPEVFYDSLNYQLGLQSQALLSGRIEVEPTMVQSSWPATFGVVFAEHLALGGVAAAKLFSWWCFVASGCGVVLLARRVGFPRSGGIPALSAVVLASVPGVCIMATTATIDHGLMLLATGVLLAVVPVLRRPRIGFAVLAAVPAGAIAGSKYTGLYFVIAVALVIGFVAARRWGRRGILPALGFVVLACVLASPWYARNFAVLGNPVWPAFDTIFGPDDAAQWAAERLAGDRAIFPRTPVGALRALHAQVFDPGRLGSGAEAGVLLPLVLLAAVISLVPRSPLARLRPLLSVLAVMWLLWFSLSPGGRYLYPVYPVAALGAASTLGLGVAAAPLIRGLTLVLLALGLLANGAKSAATIRVLNGGLSSPGAVWTALTDRETHLERLLPHYRVAGWVNETLPPDARLLFLGETRPLYFDRRVVFSSAYDRHLVQRWMDESNTAESVRSHLEAEGITHILINWAEVERLGKGFDHLRLTADEGLTLKAVLDAATRVHADGRIEVREL